MFTSTLVVMGLALASSITEIRDTPPVEPPTAALSDYYVIPTEEYPLFVCHQSDNFREYHSRSINEDYCFQDWVPPPRGSPTTTDRPLSRGGHFFYTYTVDFMVCEE